MEGPAPKRPSAGSRSAGSGWASLIWATFRGVAAVFLTTLSARPIVARSSGRSEGSHEHGDGPGPSSRSPDLRIVRVGFGHPDAMRLIAEVQQEYVARYGGDGRDPARPGRCSTLRRGSFFVGYLGDEPVASGAWRRRDDVEALGSTQHRRDQAHVRRTRPPAGSGLARAMLAHLEAHRGRGRGRGRRPRDRHRSSPRRSRSTSRRATSPVPKFGFYRDYPSVAAASASAWFRRPADSRRGPHVPSNGCPAQVRLGRNHAAHHAQPGRAPCSPCRRCSPTAGLSRPQRRPPIEDYADYQPQKKCAPKAKPGTKALARWLVRRGGGDGADHAVLPERRHVGAQGRAGRSTGCSTPAASRTAGSPQEFLELRLRRPTPHGNEHAMARRMGIMYVIWNDHMYSAWDQFERESYLSSSCKRRKKLLADAAPPRPHAHLAEPGRRPRRRPAGTTTAS